MSASDRTVIALSGSISPARVVVLKTSAHSTDSRQ